MHNHDIELALLYKETNCPDSKLITSPIGDITIFTEISPEKTSHNEDAAAIIQIDNQTLVLAVADGVGGQPAGAQASAILVDNIKDACIKSRTEKIELRDALLSGIESANKKIIESCNGSATTLAAVEINKNTIRTYHVGDSVILLVGQKGKIIMETVLHSPTGYAVESGLLSEKEAIHHDQRHFVSNVVGTKDMHVSMSMPLPIKKFDTLLLATDGLIDNLEKQIIIDTIRKGSLVNSSKILYTRASKRMTNPDKLYKPDDITCILFRPSF
ncbi:MAG: serine/threonine protein phosphatase PrpC [Gammaproteobacteria bacterium]|jgi:serine/threonine protein phosphatase PrpC